MPKQKRVDSGVVCDVSSVVKVICCDGRRRVRAELGGRRFRGLCFHRD